MSGRDVLASFPKLFRAAKRGDGLARYREQVRREAMGRGESPERAEKLADEALAKRRRAVAAAAGGLSSTSL